MKTEKRKALKKVQRAIDCLVAVQDLGQGSESVSRALENLNAVANRLDNEIERASGIGLAR